MRIHPSLFNRIKKLAVNSTIVLILGLSVLYIGCDDKVSSSKFSDTYLKILIAREQIKDSTKAGNKVAEILKENGFTEESFRQEFIRLSRTPNEFRIMMDSVQARAVRLK